jgi:hypothetical protein
VQKRCVTSHSLICRSDGTSQEWQKDIVRYMAVRQVPLLHIAFTLLNAPRHPNVVQLCGTASSGDIHATIFHDGAIHNFLNGETQKLDIDLIPV